MFQIFRPLLARVQRAGRFSQGADTSCEPRINVLIYGAGRTGRQLAAALATDARIRPVAFIDDDPHLQSLTVAGLRVHPARDIDMLTATHDIHRIILAMPSATDGQRDRLTRRLQQTGCDVHVLPAFADLVTGSANATFESRPVDPATLLGREAVEDDLPGDSNIYAGRRILVTGAGGSIGSELCRQLARCNPETLILMDHGEHVLFEIERELRTLVPDLDIIPILGSVCDAALVNVLIELAPFSTGHLGLNQEA
jgi:FlaA1/EpsC-like NDP-sugar epimerase